MASVIEGFLVSLGFDINEQSLKKFTATIDKSKKGIETLAKQGMAVGAAFALATYQVNRMYQASNNTGMSIKGMKTLQNAIQSVGGSSESVVSAITGITDNLKTIPNYSRYLKQIGVDVFDQNGKLKETSSVLIDLRNSLANMDPAKARAVASGLGIGMSDLNALLKDDFIANLRRSQSLIGELSAGMDKSAAASNRMSNEMANMWSIVSTGSQSFFSRFTEATNLDKHLASFNNTLSKYVTAIVDAEIEMIEASDGFWSYLFTRLFNDDKFQKKAWEKQGLEFSEDKNVALDEEGRPMPKEWQDRYLPKQQTPSQDVEKLELPKQQTPSYLPNTLGFRNNNVGNLRASSMANGHRGGFATFDTKETGYEALGRQLKAYSNAGLNDISSIIKKYAPDSENDTSAYIDSVTRHMTRTLGKDISSTQYLDLSNYKVIKALMDAIVRHENGAGAENYFQGGEYDRIAQSVAQSKQVSRVVSDKERAQSIQNTKNNSNVTVNQNITIVGNDPVKIGNQVKDITTEAAFRRGRGNIS